jgi:probable F420-dependent oxidoreductase
MPGLTIGKFAAAEGVGVETVRFYQRRGLLAQPERQGHGFREYSEADRWRLAATCSGPPRRAPPPRSAGRPGPSWRRSTGSCGSSPWSSAGCAAWSGSASPATVTTAWRCTCFLGSDPGQLIAVARHAEDCGFESFYVPEHIVLYPGAMLGPAPIPPALPFADPLECLSFVAAATSRILLGTAVLLLPYHHPVVLAKRLATIDVLSKGRMRLLTVGLGTLPGEAAAAGVDFASRGRRADEAIDVLRLLWAGDEHGASFDGEFFSVESVCSFPKPRDAGTLPIHVGGSSAGGAIDMSAADVAERAGLGVTRLVVGVPATGLHEQRDEMSAFAARLGLG